LTQSGHRPIGNYDAPLPATVVEEQPACFVVRDHNGQVLA